MVFHPYQRSAGGTLGSNQGQLKSLQTTPKILHESNRNLFQSQGIKPETRSVLLQPNNALLKEPHIQADFSRRRTMATDPFSTMTELDGAQVMKQWTLNPCPPPPNHCVPAKAGVYLSKEGLESKETNRNLGKHSTQAAIVLLAWKVKQAGWAFLSTRNSKMQNDRCFSRHFRIIYLIYVSVYKSLSKKSSRSFLVTANLSKWLWLTRLDFLAHAWWLPSEMT